MQAKTSTCDDKQRQFVASVGVDLPNSLPRIVVVARLQGAIAELFGLNQPKGSGSQLGFLAELAHEASEEAPSPASSAEAHAWIQYFCLRQRAEALRALRLNRGDLVSRGGSASEVDQVASIGDDGAVYFTGGRARAWPDELTVVARSDDTSPSGQDARRKAANRASERSLRSQWSITMQDSLKEYEVLESADASDIEELRRTLEMARDERPLQELFESRPCLLASLVRGPQRFCIPQVSLGGKYVADFFLADVSSSGVRWILVELETPDSATTLSRGNEFDKHARQGMSQIEEWREWLQDNLDMARRPKQQNGLGLLDIRPQAEGLVLVGRRDQVRENAPTLRNRRFETHSILMHTYDWLLEQLEGTLSFNGPWASNPYAI